jgi:hypothetical protein
MILTAPCHLLQQKIELQQELMSLLQQESHSVWPPEQMLHLLTLSQSYSMASE